MKRKRARERRKRKGINDRSLREKHLRERKKVQKEGF
jgi:hypothetical protein